MSSVDYCIDNTTLPKDITNQNREVSDFASTFAVLSSTRLFAFPLSFPVQFFTLSRIAKRTIESGNKFLDLIRTLEISSNEELTEIRDMLHEMIGKLDHAIKASENEWIQFAHKREILNEARILQENQIDLWEDFCILADKNKMEELENSEQRMNTGTYITHEEFWKRINVPDKV